MAEKASGHGVSGAVESSQHPRMRADAFHGIIWVKFGLDREGMRSWQGGSPALQKAPSPKAAVKIGGCLVSSQTYTLRISELGKEHNNGIS